MRTFAKIALVGALIVGCGNEKQVSEEGTPQKFEEERICGDDGVDVVLPTAREACVFRQPIVIETGFSCPSKRTERHDFASFSACTNFTPLLDIEFDFLQDRFGVGSGWTVGDPVVAPPETEKLDLVWVIDNSGSMAQEQKVLRENFAQFVRTLESANVDLRMAVTTTQMVEDYPLEPVAQPGAFQATPQPVPGFDRTAHLALDENGETIPGDYTPVLEAIAAGVECMESPDPSFLDVTTSDIECALYGEPVGCEIAGVCGVGECLPGHLFPDPSLYREIPRVLSTRRYEVDGRVDVESMERDFACMSLVGTRGYGVEAGLAAAVRAISPATIGEMNAGFLRDDARFAVMFVTDENDCSHDGSLDPSLSACGGDICEFANAAGDADSPLVPVHDLKVELMQNLMEAKGREVSDSEVFVGSIHGNASRWTGEAPTEDACMDAGYSGVQPTCSSSLGVAYSGDRYERFLLQFPPGNFFPAPQEDGRMTGWMCTGDFAPAITALGTWLAAEF